MVSLRASPLFALAVLLTLGLAGLNGLMVLLMQLQPGFMGMAHFIQPHHRTHDLTFGFLFLPAVAGMLAQLWRPSSNIAGQLMALIPWIGLVLTLGLTLVLTSNTSVLNLAWLGVAGSTTIATILHPSGRHFFRSFSVSRVNWVMLGLVVIAAVPLLAFAATHIGLQGTVTNDHAVLGHYGFMAALSFTIIGVGLLASLRPDGWRLAAWVAGLLPVLLGLTSVVLPDVDSSLGLVWALAAIAWGAGFVATTEVMRGGRTMADLPPSADSNGESTTSTPPWAYVFGIIVLVLIVLFGGMHLAGGGPGPGLHAPPAGGHTPP